METLKTPVEFLEYLHERPATTELAETLAQVFVLRGYAVPRVETAARLRVAS